MNEFYDKKMLSQGDLWKMNLAKSGLGAIFSRFYRKDKISKKYKDEKIPCCSEELALIHFLDLIETDVNDGQIALYVVDLDVIMPKLKEKLQKYGLLKKFQKKVRWVCDLKAIVRSKESLNHLKTFCWPNFHLIFQDINESDIFPFFPRSMINAKELAEHLWFTTCKLFKTEELQECEEFIDYFYDSKVLLQSDLPMSSNEEQNPQKGPSKLRYQSCVFDIAL